MPAAVWKNRRRSRPCLPPRSSAIASSRASPSRPGVALPFVLRIGIKFVAGDDLGGDRGLVLTQFGRHQRGKFFFGEIAAHAFAPWPDWPKKDNPRNPRLSACSARDRAMLFSRCSAHLVSKHQARVRLGPKQTSREGRNHDRFRTPVG